MADVKKQSRSKFDKRLDAFLENRVQQPDEGGYPIVTDETIGELRQIIHDLLNLKFELDEDGDMVIQFALANAKREKLCSFTMPHRPRSDDLDEEILYIDRLARAADSASYYANDATKMLEFHTGELRRRMASKNKLKEDIESVSALLSAKDLEGAQKRLQELYREYDKDGAKRENEKDEDWSCFWRVPDEFDELLTRLSRLVPEKVAQAETARMMSLLDQIEPLVGAANHGFEKKVGELGIRREFNKIKFRLGNRVVPTAIKRYNEMLGDDRAIRALFKRGVTVTTSLQAVA